MARLIATLFACAMILQVCLAAAPPAPAKPAAAPAGTTKPATGGGLDAPDLSSFRAILQTSGVGDLGDATATVFAPTNAAVAAGLGRLGLTENDVRTKQHLADAIVGAHLVTGYSLAPGDILAQAAAFPDGRVPVYTRALPDHVVVAAGSGDKGPVTVTGQRGVVGRVVRVVRERKHTVIVVDALVSPGSVFGSLEDLFAYSGASLAAARATLLASGKFSPATLQARGAATPGALTGTLFLPRTFAFAATGLIKPQPLAATQQQGVQAAPAPQLLLPPKEAARLVGYWSLKARRAIPDDFTSGARVDTLLPGQTLSVVFDTKSGASERDIVVDARGQRYNTTRANIYIGGSGVVHVVGGVPLPAAADAAAVSKAAPGTVNAPKAAPTTTVAGRRHRSLLQTPAPLPAWTRDTKADPQSVTDATGAATAKHAVAEDDTAQAVSSDSSKALGRWNPDAAKARPSLPAWAKPSVDLGKNLDTLNSGTRNGADAVDAINAQVKQYDNSECC